jgi:hypothetical protein
MSGIIAPLQYTQCTQAAAATIREGKALFNGFVCISSTSGTITVYDNTSATGTKIYENLAISAGQLVSLYEAGIVCKNGIHVVVGGTATVNVLFA